MSYTSLNSSCWWWKSVNKCGAYSARFFMKQCELLSIAHHVLCMFDNPKASWGEKQKKRWALLRAGYNVKHQNINVQNVTYHLLNALILNHIYNPSIHPSSLLFSSPSLLSHFLPILCASNSFHKAIYSLFFSFFLFFKKGKAVYINTPPSLLIYF